MSKDSGGMRHAFTMVELLVVVGIMAVLMGLVFAIPKHEEREGQVRGAAEELAAVMRETRTRAMRNNCTYGISFNIQNAPGSSGRILNNRSGGHWYRVIGPYDGMLAGVSYNYRGAPAVMWGKPPLFLGGLNYVNGGFMSIWSNQYNVIKQYVDLVNRCWVEEAHRLAKGKVRFVALTDQDNGDNAWPGIGGYYSKTYPRPWFGYWDAATDPAKPELRTWGGYDPELKLAGQAFWEWAPGWFTRNNATVQVNGRPISHSGFYYEGYEGEITGCVNPNDRPAYDDVNGDGVGDSDASKTYALMVKGAPRPLIDGNWLDFTILFWPDGSVTTDWFRLREGCQYLPGPGFDRMFPRTAADGDPQITTFPRIGQTDEASRFLSNGVPDRCAGQSASGYDNSFDTTGASWGVSRIQREATDYVDRTGFYWITLAPDTVNDDGRYRSPELALRDLLPLYRVGVSPQGRVKVLRVRTTNYQNRSFDPAITGADWEDKNKIWGTSGKAWFRPRNDPFEVPTAPNYMNHELRNTDYSPRGEPVVDVVLPEMLRERKWWWLVP